IVRPPPTDAHLAKNIKVQRCVSDVVLLSSSTEYISYLDGVNIAREKSSLEAVCKRFKKTMSAREYCDSKTTSLKPEKNEKNKQYYIMPEETKQAGNA
ncbi:MAG: hypothetical protein ACWGQW_21525, partial [bacterium]